MLHIFIYIISIYIHYLNTFNLHNIVKLLFCSSNLSPGTSTCPNSMLFKSRTVSVHGQRYLISYLYLFVASSLLLLERSFSQKSQSWIYCYQGTLSRRHKPTACTTSAHSLGFNIFTILQIHTITNRLEKKRHEWHISLSPNTHTKSH